METKREGFGSNFGFIMAAVGSAVGLGNIWGFPYKMGMNGGFSFLLIYLGLALFVGLAVMVGELAIGRKTGKSPIAAYRAMSKKFTWMGYIAVAVPFLVLCFYFVLGGMVMRYAGGYLLAMFGVNTFGDDITAFFGNFICNGGSMVLWTFIFIVLNAFIVSRGVGGGIEKFCNIGMPCLFVILIVVIVYVAIQPGAMDGYGFMFGWNLDPLKAEGGFMTVLKTAAGQMFFSLSLGMGAMITYGSYLAKGEKLQKNAVIIVVMDTMVAIMAGMIVMPACFAFLGGNTSSGPGLLFASMQCVFDAMGGFIGNLMGFLFYFLVFIAAISSSMSLLEAITAARVDSNVEKGKAPKRAQTAIIFALIIFVFCLPTALDGLGSGVNSGCAIGYPAEILGTAWAEQDTPDGFAYKEQDIDGFAYTYKFFPSNTTELGDGVYYTKGEDGAFALVEAGAKYDADTAYYTRADYYTASADAKADPEAEGVVYDANAVLVEAGAEFDANATYYQRDAYKVLGEDGKYSSVGVADAFSADTTYYKNSAKGWNCDWLDFYDMLSEGIMMPLGAMIMAFAIGWIWKIDTVIEEAEQCGNKFWGKGFFNLCYKFITPIGMAFVLYGQITSFFG